MQTNASPWHARSAGTNQSLAPPPTAAFVADVAGRVEHPGRRAEARAAGGSTRSDRPAAAAEATSQSDDRADRSATRRRSASRARAPSRTRPPSAAPMPNALARAKPSGAERENADAAGRGRLHERERREPERDDVQHPAADPAEEADEPAAVAKQRDASDCNGPAHVKRGRRDAEACCSE